MSELSRREAIILTAAATLVAPAEANAADQPAATQLLFDVLAAPSDPMSIPINIISKQGRKPENELKVITVSAATKADETPDKRTALLTVEFKKQKTATVNLNARLRFLSKPTDPKADTKLQNFSVWVKEEGYAEADTNETIAKQSRPVSIGKATCLPPTSATQRLSTQPVSIKQNRVTVKCVAPQPPTGPILGAAAPAAGVSVPVYPIWQIDSVKVAFAANQSDLTKAENQLVTVTSKNPTIKTDTGAVEAGLSVDGLLQVDLDIVDTPPNKIGWIAVTWKVSATASGEPGLNNLEFTSMAPVRFG